jgi:predicted dehydrogenase
MQPEARDQHIEHGQGDGRTCVVIGAGIRGREIYGRWIARHPARARVVAVAEPNAERRHTMAGEHGLAEDRQFTDWRELLNRPRLADTCLVMTQDQDHTEPATAALRAGYHVLLEKPMATTPAECRQLVRTAEETKRELRVCHVMRYAPLFQRAHAAVADGRIGRVLHIEHSENVAYWHFAHSYVRGQWRRSDESSPIILAKSCHDLDIIYWLVGAPYRRVHAFGSRVHFRSESAPAGAPARCTDGCPVAESCVWYAPRLYLEGQPIAHVTQYATSPVVRVLGRLAKPLMRRRFRRWPATVISDDLSRQARLDALKTGPYGRCVYHCDNDVPDQQSINLEFENGITASMSLHGFSYLDGRWFRIDGSAGTLRGHFTYAGQELRLHRHEGASELLYRSGLDAGGHGEADAALMEAYFPRAAAPTAGDSRSLTSAAESLESHLAAFAVEQSRSEGRIVTLKEERE